MKGRPSVTFLEEAFGVSVEPGLLARALTHRSYAYENGGLPTNERLEFLGDSVLCLVVTDTLFRTHPDLPEGQLAKLRASVVNMRALAGVARGIGPDGLGAYLHLGRGEESTGGRNKSSILADALEALLGAVYLDGGFAMAEKVIANLFTPLLQELDSGTPGKDPKTLLQEYLQSRRLALPQYVIIATTGEAHQQHFKVECAISKLDIRTMGEGASRRKAEQEAAKQAYEKIREQLHPQD